MPTIDEISNDSKHYNYEHGFVSPPLKNSPNQIILDENRAIIGYLIPITRTRKWAEEQGLTDHKSLLEFSQTVYQSTTQHYICLHGYENTSDSRKAYLYKEYESAAPVSRIVNHELQKFLDQMCLPAKVDHPTTISPQPNANRVKDAILLSFSNWPAFDYNNSAFNNISVISLRLYTGLYLVLIMGLERNNGTFIETKLYLDNQYFDDYYFVFGYNKYLRFFFCGQKCNLKSVLSWMDLKNINSTHSQFQWNHIKSRARLTIAKLLGCRRPLISEPDFDSFCANTQTFQSIFSLGKDLYFQSSSRFWRIPHNRFTNESNPLLDHSVTNKYHLRVESEFGAILSATHMDVSYPLHGFAYRMKESDVCSKGDHKCNKQQLETGSYLGVCIYGKRLSVGTKSTPTTYYDYTGSFYHTPYGFRHFRNRDLFLKSLAFCKRIVSMNPIILSITSTDVLKRDGKPDSLDVDVLFILTTIDTKKGNNRKVIKRAFWRKGWYDPNNLIWEYDVYEEEEPQLTNSIFFIGGQLYTSELDKMGLAKPKGKQGYTYERKEISKFFDCPFNTIASTVRLYKENVCDNNHKNLAESVFTVGTKLYHQRDKYFYEWRPDKQTFRYDHSITELLNEYFDTTYRLTAYSVEPLEFYEQGDFVVIFHGKSSVNLETLGQYIFARFIYNSSTSYLRPIKKGKNSETTIGTIDPKLTSMGFIDAMGDLIKYEPDLKNLIVWIKEDVTKKQFQLMQEFNWTDMLTPSRFENKFVSYDYSNVPFKDVVGIYRDMQDQIDTLRVVAYKKSGNAYNMDKLVVFAMNPKDGLSQIDSMDRFYELRDYYPIGCHSTNDSTQHSKSESKSSSKTLSIILAVLLLILLILSFAVGFYKSREKENIHSAKDSNVDTEPQPSKL